MSWTGLPSIHFYMRIASGKILFAYRTTVFHMYLPYLKATMFHMPPLLKYFPYFNSNIFRLLYPIPSLPFIRSMIVKYVARERARLIVYERNHQPYDLSQPDPPIWTLPAHRTRLVSFPVPVWMLAYSTATLSHFGFQFQHISGTTAPFKYL